MNNYETTRVKNHIMNVEENYQFYMGLYLGYRVGLSKEAAKEKMAKTIKADLRKKNPMKTDNSIYADLLAAALDNVDYDLIAEEIEEEYETF